MVCKLLHDQVVLSTILSKICPTLLVQINYSALSLSNVLENQRTNINNSYTEFPLVFLRFLRFVSILLSGLIWRE